MKSLRSAVVVLAVVIMAACLAGSSFAGGKGNHKDWQEAYQAKIKILRDSAAALQSAEPDLAKGLNDLAAEKEKRMQEMADMKAKSEAKVKLLRDSAAALQKTNPDIAKELWNMSDYKHKGKMDMGKNCPMGMKGYGKSEE